MQAERVTHSVDDDEEGGVARKSREGEKEGRKERCKNRRRIDEI
jgi:hypothetical protein